LVRQTHAIVPIEKRVSESITADPTRLAGAATMMEAGMVILSRKGEQGLEDLRTFTARAKSYRV
jgi:hypothetical protein